MLISPFVGLGHSHIVALAKAFYAEHALGMEPWRGMEASFHYLHAPEFKPLISSNGGEELGLNPAVKQLLLRPELGSVLLSVGGNEHNEFSFAPAFKNYDFRLSEQPGMPCIPGAIQCPEAVVAEALRDWLAQAFKALSLIRAVSPLPLVFVESPPPLPRSHILNIGFGPEGSNLSDADFTADSIRYKVWRLSCRMFREECSRVGAHYVSNPENVCDADGLLALRYCGSDATHANAAYGLRMLNAVNEQASQ